MNTKINENSLRQAQTNKSFLICLSKKHIVFSLLIWFISLSVSAQKTYHKNYFDNGHLQSEGWIKDNQKINYWKFYYNTGTLKKEGHFKNNNETKYWKFYLKNGNIEKEGHFKNGNTSNWWLFYDSKKKINHKCQLKNNQKNGYCLMYKNEKLVSASKYNAGKKIKKWTNFAVFRKENNLRDLK